MSSPSQSSALPCNPMPAYHYLTARELEIAREAVYAVRMRWRSVLELRKCGCPSCQEALRILEEN